MVGEKPRVAFLGTSTFAVPTLEALASTDYRPLRVYTRPDRPSGRGRLLQAPPVKARALELGLQVYQPESVRTLKVVDDLQGLRPDVLVVAAYGAILPREILAVAPLGALNLHPSLLPHYRGPSPIVGALLAGDTETGATVFLMEEGVDTGSILGQLRISIRLGETAETLTARLAKEGAGLLLDTLHRWLHGQIEPEPQDEASATTTRLLRKADGELDWRKSAEELERQVRAMQPWPGAMTRWRGRLLRVLEARVVPLVEDWPLGKVLGREDLGTSDHLAVGVVTGRGSLGLVQVQQEGRLPINAEEFLRGARDFVGSVLPS